MVAAVAEAVGVVGGCAVGDAFCGAGVIVAEGVCLDVFDRVSMVLRNVMGDCGVGLPHGVGTWRLSSFRCRAPCNGRNGRSPGVPGEIGGRSP